MNDTYIKQGKSRKHATWANDNECHICQNEGEEKELKTCPTCKQKVCNTCAEVKCADALQDYCQGCFEVFLEQLGEKFDKR